MILLFICNNYIVQHNQKSA